MAFISCTHAMMHALATHLVSDMTYDTKT